MYAITHSATVGVIVDGATNASIAIRVDATKTTLVKFDLSHSSNVGLTFVISKARDLTVPLSNVIGNHILFSTNNAVLTLDVHVLQLSLAGGTSAYIGYASQTKSVATLSLIGHVAGAGTAVGDVIARDLVCGNALFGCPANNVNGQSVMLINNASLGGKGGVIQIGAGGVTTTIYGARCKDSTGATRLIISESGVNFIGTLSNQGKGVFSDGLSCTSVTIGTAGAGAITIKNNAIECDSIAGITFNRAISIGTNPITAGAGSTLGTFTFGAGTIDCSDPAVAIGKPVSSSRVTASESGSFGNIVVKKDSINTTGTGIHFDKPISAAGRVTGTEGAFGNVTVKNAAISCTDAAGIAFDKPVTGVAESKFGAITLGASGKLTATEVSTGNVSMGTNGLTSSTGVLSFNGANAETAGTVEAAAFLAISDRRYKRFIKPLTHSACLSMLSKMATYTYELRFKPGKKRVGLIAQELLDIAPHLVHVMNEGKDNEHYTVNYQDLAAYAISAVSALWWRLKCVAAATLLALVLLSCSLIRLSLAQ